MCTDHWQWHVTFIVSELLMQARTDLQQRCSPSQAQQVLTNGGLLVLLLIVVQFDKKGGGVGQAGKGVYSG